jgi:ankyrin repeat protein
LPETLDETYERVLQEIGDQNWEYAHRLFQCVTAASRPLRVEELAEFLAFDFSTGSTPTFLDDWRSEDPAHTVLSTCSSLLAIVDMYSSSVIQFTHFSVKEYLMSKRLAKSKDTISRFYVSMAPAHTIVAQACLGVLLHIDETITEDDLKKFPLVKYAARHWVGHARFSDVSRNIEDGMKRLFDPDNRHLAVWVWIYDPESPERIHERSRRPSEARATPLHYAAVCGIQDIIEFLIVERSQDINARGFDRNETPLGVASREGHSEVARVLLEHGADTESRDNDTYSPLERASEEGHTEIVQVLLEHGADVKAVDDEVNVMALHFASMFGRLAAARVLLEHGADADAKSKDNQTPLHQAENEGVARVLLEYGADPNVHWQGEDNRTPLHEALECDRLEVTRVLLENGANANVQDSYNQTPLHLASRKGCLDVVRLLLQRCSNIHAQDDEGRTPFQVASVRGHEEVMRLLLEHGAKDHRTQ